MKRYVTGFFIILFTLLLALGGLFLPGFLMDQQQHSLFAKTETIHLPTAEAAENKTFIQFSPEQLFPIAISYGEVVNWNAYDSSNGDLTTEYLIQTTNEQISQLCQLGILPEIFLNATYTWERIERGTTWFPNESEYSSSILSSETEEISEEPEHTSNAITRQNYNGWVFYCGNSDLTIHVHINASSGQILNLSATWPNKDDNSTTPNSSSYILKQYLDYLELSDVPHTAIENDSTSCRFDDYRAALVIQLGRYYAEYPYSFYMDKEMEALINERIGEMDGMDGIQNENTNYWLQISFLST